MTRYFFNIYDGVDVFDDTGTLLKDMGEVHIHMHIIARAWAKKRENQTLKWRMEARDENERLVGSMRFAMVPGNGT